MLNTKCVADFEGGGESTKVLVENLEDWEDLEKVNDSLVKYRSKDWMYILSLCQPAALQIGRKIYAKEIFWVVETLNVRERVEIRKCDKSEVNNSVCCRAIRFQSNNISILTQNYDSHESRMKICNVCKKWGKEASARPADQIHLNFPPMNQIWPPSPQRSMIKKTIMDFWWILVFCFRKQLKCETIWEVNIVEWCLFPRGQ